MVETEGGDEEFEFYLKFAKPLVFNLPDTNDRIKAAAWIRYLKADKSDLILRGEYLKLLLFVLQRRRLYGPFSSIPNDNEPLPKFPDEINIQDVAKNFVEIDKKILQATLEKGGYGEWPPYNVACSSDLTEYATSQEIPGFGVHVFCAFSRDPLPTWNHFERAIFPIGENVDTSKPECPLVDTGSPDISCFVSPEKPEPPAPSESPRRSPRIPPGGPKEQTPTSDVTPKSPPKEPSPFKEDEFGMDDRVPPSWGSNLVDVKDLSIEPIPSPVKDLDIEVSDKDMLDFFHDDVDLYEADLDEATSYLQGDLFSPEIHGTPIAPGSPEPSRESPRSICPSSGGPCPADDAETLSRAVSLPRSHATSPLPSAETPPHYSPQLPKDYFTSPHKMFDMLHDLAADRDMLDYFQDSPKLPENDPAFYLQGFKLKSPEMLAIEPPPTSPRPLTPKDEVKRLEREFLYPDDELRRLELEAAGIPLPPSPERPPTPRAPCAPLPPSPTRMPPLSPPGALSPSPPCASTEDEALGGDSFIAPEKKDYRWLADTSPGPGIPIDEQQDPALWESFGWWTEDPDEIFQYMSPSLRVRRTPEEDPFAEERKRWGDVIQTPPIFSKDPKIREGPAARRQYTIDEFGMESFEEPVWTSAEQYFKYMREFSPHKDPRDIDRKAYDPADYPKIELPEMSRRLTDIHAAPEEAEFFREELSPELLDVTLADEDLKPLTKTEAMMEAMHHGPRFIGFPTPEPEKTPKEDSGEWEDIKFIEETPPLFMLEPPLLATPPEYELNPTIEVDELDEDTLRRCNEEDLKLINAMIPVTVPQRAPSPRRLLAMTEESPLFAPDIEEEPEPYIPSPELVMPEKHVVPSQKTVDWDTNIGSPIKLPETTAVVEVSIHDLVEKNIKRRQELAVIYERQFESPPQIPSPPPMPHLMDAPTPFRLPPAMTPVKLPPPGWSWKTPEKYIPKPYIPKETKTPTGISPPRPIPKDLTMFHESPPEDFYSPDFDFDMALLSPPKPSPPKQLQGQAIPMSYWQKDVIERELHEPTADDLEDIQLPDIPDIVLTPERVTSTPIVQEFVTSEIKDLQPEMFAATPQAAAEHVVVSTTKPPQVKTKPPPRSKLQKPGLSKSKIGKPAQKSKLPKIPRAAPPKISKKEADELEQEIRGLEAELFPQAPRDVRPRRPAPTLPQPVFSPPTPEHQRRLWRQQLEMHDYIPYRKKSFVIQPTPGKSLRVAKYSHRPQLSGIPDSLTSPPLTSAESIGSPSAEMSPERAAWREQVRQHEKTPFKRKIFHVRPKHGKAIALRGAKIPTLDTVVDTSPVAAEDLDDAIKELEAEVFRQSPKSPSERTVVTENLDEVIREMENKIFEQSPKSPEDLEEAIRELEAEVFLQTQKSPSERTKVPPTITVEQLNEEIAKMEEELVLLTTPPRRRHPDDSPETPRVTRDLWRESVKQSQVQPYTKSRKHYKAPSLATILSPGHPDFARRERDRYLEDLERQAARAVELDKTLLSQEQEKDLYPLSKQHQERVQYEMSEEEQEYWRSRRYDFEIPSPPESPIPPPSILDEELPEGLPPCLLPPSGWSWKTPEKFKQKSYIPKEKKVPTGISPPRPIPPELTMFHESPPEDMFYDDFDIATLSPPDISPRTPSPPRVPQTLPQTSIVPTTYWQKDAIDRELQLPALEDLDDIQLHDIPDFVTSPEEAPVCPAATTGVCPTATLSEQQALRRDIERNRIDFPENWQFYIRKGEYMVPAPKFGSPTLPTIPDMSPPTPQVQKSREQIIREIQELYSKMKSPTRQGKKPRYDPDSPPTPERFRKHYKFLTEMHEMVPYVKKRKHYKAPKLRTILSPRHPDFEERQRQDKIRTIDRHALAGVTLDIKKMREEQKKNLFQHSERHRMRVSPRYQSTVCVPDELKGRYDVHIPSPPQPVVSPEPPPHILDEPVPEGQPQALLPPSGWTWKTPEKYQPKSYVPKEKKVPTGISPPRPIPKELTMFHESPPEELYTSEFYEDLNMAMLSPPDISPRTPSPPRTPQGQIVPYGYWQKDVIDRELQEPTDIDNIEMPAIADNELSPEEPSIISPEREAWKSTIQKHKTVPFRRKIFHVRPKPGRAIALRGAKRPSLPTVADTSPPEPAPIVEEVSEEISTEQLDREIEALEAELEMLRTPPKPKTPVSSEGSPPTPEVDKRIWREMIRLHEPVPYTKKVTYSQPPKLETIFSQEHPSFTEFERERYIREMRRQAERAVRMDVEHLMEEKEKDLYPLSEQHQERAQYEMSDAEMEYWRTRRYDFEVPSPPLPQPVPEVPLHILDEPLPEGLPPGLLPPSGWTYKTPPQMKYRMPEERKIKTPTGIRSPKLPTMGTLFYESPPLISPEPESPETSTPPPLALTKPLSPLLSPGGRAIVPYIPPDTTDLDVALYYPSEYEEIDTELPPELYSSPEFDEPFVDPQLEAEIKDLETEVFGATPREIRPRRPPPSVPSPEFSPPTPEYQRKIWKQELEMHDYIPYTKKSFIVKPKPGKSVRVAKFSHRQKLGTVPSESPEPAPQVPAEPTADDIMEAEIRDLEAEVFGPSTESEVPSRRLPIRPHAPEFSPPTPEHQKRLWRQQLEMHEYTPYTRKAFSVKPKPGKSVRVTKFGHRPKFEAVEEKYYEVSPVSPPLKPRPPQQISIPSPVVTVPPENWTWQTPSPLTKKGIYSESPPLVYSPPSPSSQMPQAASPIKPTTPTPSSMLFRRPAPPSPLRSPGGRPVLQGLQDRPLDTFELAQAVPQDFDAIDFTSPDMIEFTYTDMADLETPTPPAPPPRPPTVQAFVPQPRRIPGRRAPLDPNVLYADTPVSAQRNYGLLPETIRFESVRPIALKPTTPEAPKGYYETPVPPGTRPWRKRRKAIQMQPVKRRLQFEEEEEDEKDEEDERVKILELQSQLLARSPPRDMMIESPPDMSPDAEWLGDLVYEPPIFNLYRDEEVPDYDIRPAFEGQPDVDLMDTSPIETIERIPVHLRDFRWMDSSCGSRCPWGKR